ncbi:MAG: methylated-DNA--[protein]-cysteine S-methyltransferase [Fretibacterium sp.]|nr:methylated-DNA--[protein]-cysteine S-methyltransferase [Fretibacterium sp.]
MRGRGASQTLHAHSFNTPIGRLTLIEEAGALVRLLFEKEGEAAEVLGARFEETAFLREATCQLEEYFERRRRVFTLPLRFSGTDFQLRVWNALLAIPYGQTRTYGQIAAAIGSPKASRAVGGANHRNRLPIVIPCHRVVAAGGGLGGFGGGLEVKEKLLRLEGGR